MIRVGFGGIGQARREVDGMHDGALRINTGHVILSSSQPK